MNLKINDSIHVSDITAADKPAYLEHLKEKQIQDQTGAIPYPYTGSDADWWITQVSETTAKLGRSINWAIRRADGFLVGGIGFHDFELGKSHRAEIGYWLAKPYWNQGIMTECVRKVTDYGFQEFGLVRIFAPVFDFNVGSARVLEKAGYLFEGTLRKHYLKEGRFLDGKMYAKIV
jgi:ribosomal-protein-alanine N-acetyltransferase